MDKDTSRQSTGQGPAVAETLDKSLLVVDDDRVFCDRLARALSSRGFTARTAIRVAEALAAIETAPPAFESTSGSATAAGSTSCALSRRSAPTRGA
jgi:PleD family two-component response regulator